MNVDASVSIADQTAGVGGVLRDGYGTWLFGFTRFLGRCATLLTELWTIHDGLLHAWVLGYCQVELESGCLVVVRIVNSRSDVLAGCTLVDSIRRLIRKD
ncbi:hypothetical protein V6N11_075399 [Hibiscus sabdariffa]|uniref:RNase H type-1 domain-containing protein n=1 Tax=Hibiscus sabdariffa TaxID=183260 RepID=A0ABR2R6K8_9ROSI